MGYITPLQSSFNGGEVSPHLCARIDQSFYGISLAAMVGFLPTIEGPAEACPGFIRVATARANDVVFFTHEFTSTQSYLIEASAGAFRFFTNEAQIMAGGLPYEVAHPYSYAALRQMATHQAGEYLYLYHRDYQTRRLVRTGAESFALELVEYRNGPFERRNDVETIRVSANNVTGNVTLTATHPIFAAGDVGGLFRIEAGDFGTIRQWAPGISGISNGQKCQNNSVVYQCVGGTGRTGDVAPTHGEGIEWDGIGTGKDLNDKPAGGVQWKYVHDRYGVLKITGFIDAYNVSALVIRHLPMTLAYQYEWEYDPDDPGGWSQAPYTPLSHRWSFGLFSDKRGWPETGSMDKERHVVGRDNYVCGSVIGDFSDFNPLNEFGDVSRDMGFVTVLPPGDFVRWIASDVHFMVGTDRHEYVLKPSSTSSGIGPGNIDSERQGDSGSLAGVMPMSLDGRALFVQRSGALLLEFGYSFQRDRYESPDLTRYCGHLVEDGIAGLAWQGKPDGLIWLRTESGQLRALAYDPKEQLLGACQRGLPDGVAAAAIATITASDGRRSQLWAALTLGGVTQICRLARRRRATDRASTKVMSDLAFVHDGAASSVFSAPWLANRTIEGVADGVPFVASVAADGAFSTDFAAAQVVAGLPFPAYVDLLPLEGGADNGASQGKKARIGRVMVRLHQSDGVRLRVQGQVPQVIESGNSDNVADSALPLLDGDYTVETVGAWDNQRRLRVERFLPKPVTLLGVMTYADVGNAAGRNP